MAWFWKQVGEFQKEFAQGQWAELFGNWLVIGGLSIAILIWATIAAVRLRIGIKSLCRALDSATASLTATPRRAREFAASYEAIGGSLQDAKIVGPAWRDWSATVITPEAAGTPVRSTSRPYTYFSLDLLRYCRINPRLHAAMPNLLVGVGLLLTFIGLAVALSSAGGMADPGVDNDIRQKALKKLLDVASAKFVTSLTGLLCSLAYTIYRGSQLDKAERSLDRFLAALEERIVHHPEVGDPVDVAGSVGREVEQELILAGAAGQDIVASSTHQDVVAAGALEGVVAGAAFQPVGQSVPDKCVVLRAAGLVLNAAARVLGDVVDLHRRVRRPVQGHRHRLVAVDVANLVTGRGTGRTSLM